MGLTWNYETGICSSWWAVTGIYWKQQNGWWGMILKLPVHGLKSERTLPSRLERESKERAVCGWTLANYIAFWKVLILAQEWIKRQWAFPALDCFCAVAAETNLWKRWFLFVVVALGDSKRPVKLCLRSWQPASLGAGHSVGLSSEKMQHCY